MRLDENVNDFDENDSDYDDKKSERCKLAKVLTRTWLITLLISIFLCCRFYSSVHEFIYSHDVSDALLLLGYKHVNTTAILHGSEILTWIPTREGLTSRFFQLERIHSMAKSYGRSLRIVDTISVHYKDLQLFSICDVFNLPETITCVHANSDTVVRKLKNCTKPPVPQEFNSSAQPFNAKGFGISKYNERYISSEQFSWQSSLCTMAFGFFFPIMDSDLIPIKFTDKAKQLATKAKIGLGIYPTKATGSGEFVVAHWRRGDQMNKCKMSKEDENAFLVKDTSVNCASPLEFIDAVHAELRKRGILPHETTIFVSTNEMNKNYLQHLSAAGFKLLSDTHLEYHLSSLDLFTIELQLMIDATHFLGWGSTGIHDFVERARSRSQRPSLPAS